MVPKQSCHKHCYANKQNGVRFGSLGLNMSSSNDGAPSKTLQKVAIAIKHLHQSTTQSFQWKTAMRAYTLLTIYTNIAYPSNSPPDVSLLQIQPQRTWEGNFICVNNTALSAPFAFNPNSLVKEIKVSYPNEVKDIIGKILIDHCGFAQECTSETNSSCVNEHYSKEQFHQTIIGTTLGLFHICTLIPENYQYSTQVCFAFLKSQRVEIRNGAISYKQESAQFRVNKLLPTQGLFWYSYTLS